jgi:hypothetical protein
MSEFTSVLFARPNMIEGAARILDFGNTLTEYNRALTPEQADAMATAADWRAVYDDLRAAYTAYIEEHPELANARSG